MGPALSGFLRRLWSVFTKKKQVGEQHGFSVDSQFGLSLHQVSPRERSPQAKILEDALRAEIEQMERKRRYRAVWDSLNIREQEVTALMCLGYSGVETANVLQLSYETVRSYSKRVYRKFGLKRKELRAALGDLDVAAWWEVHTR